MFSHSGERNKPQHTFRDMSSKEMMERKRIVKAFNKQFWAKHDMHNEPRMEREDYTEIFSKITEILARLRVNISLNYTMTGNACNYLLQLTEAPQPNEQFMRAVIHEALKDSKGYVARLTKEKIDRFIDDHLLFERKKHEKHEQDKKNKISKLQESWQQTTAYMDHIFKRNKLEESLGELFVEDQSTNEPYIIEIVDKLGNLNRALGRLKEFQQKRQLKAQQKGSHQQPKKSKIEPSTQQPPQTSESVTSPTEQPKEQSTTTPSTSTNEEKSEVGSSSAGNTSGVTSEQQSTHESVTTPTEQPKDQAGTNPSAPTEQVDTQDQSSDQEGINEGSRSEEEENNQKQIDEKIMIEVKKVGESVEQIQEKVKSLNQDTTFQNLQHLSELPLSEKKAKVNFLRKSTISLAEKLSEHLFHLDQLVGSSEKVRPYKKQQVNQVQNILTQVDDIQLRLKNLESELKKQEQEKQEQEKQTQSTQTESQQSPQQTQQTQSPQQSHVQQTSHQQAPSQKPQSQPQPTFTQHQQSQKPQATPQHHIEKHQPEKREVEEVRRIGNVPLPSKELWSKLRYEAEFEVKKLPGKYHMQAFIPNLALNELKISEKDNKLTITGTRYPTEEEEKKLVQKMVNVLRIYNTNVREWSEKDFMLAILKLGSGSYGTFSATYALPDDYDENKKITASYQRGILEIEIPIVVHRPRSFHPFFGLGEDNFSGFRPSFNSFW